MDKNQAVKLITEDPQNYHGLSVELKQDIEIASKYIVATKGIDGVDSSIEFNPVLYVSIIMGLDNIHVVKSVMKNYVPRAIKSTVADMMFTLYPLIMIEYISDSMRDNGMVIGKILSTQSYSHHTHTYICKHATIFRSISPRLRDDPTIVNLALMGVSGNMVHVSPRIKSDKESILNLMHFTWECIKHIDEPLRVDEDILEECLKKTPEYTNNRQLITGVAELVVTPELAMIAAKRNYMYVQNIPDLSDDILVEMGKSLMRLRPFSFVHYPRLQRNDIVERIITDMPKKYDAISIDSKGVKEIAIAAVSGWNNALKYVPDELKSDLDVISASLTNDPKSSKYIPDDVREKMKEYKARSNLEKINSMRTMAIRSKRVKSARK